jgi:hypothetical protein
MLDYDLLRAAIQLACYDDDGGDGGDGNTGGTGGNTGGVGGDGVGGDGVGGDGVGGDGGNSSATTFTQEQINRYLAEDRRKNEKKYKEQMRVELQKRERMYNELLANQNLTAQERDQLQTALQDVEGKLHSEKEMLLKQKKQVEDDLTAKLKTAEESAQVWANRYKESSIKRQLMDAAVTHDAYSAQQLVNLLRPKTNVEPLVVDGKETGEFKVVVDLDDLVEDKPVVTKLDPDAAVKRMRELKSLYGNLFKANVVSGVGGNSNTDSGSGSGKVDVTKLTPARYQKLRKENPALLGL